MVTCNNCVFTISDNGKILYNGNRIFKPSILKNTKTSLKNLSVDGNVFNSHLIKINSSILSSCVEYFNNLGAIWCTSPLITQMITSPGEIFRGEQINYTTDSPPIKVKWFDGNSEVYLSESTQFYLEMILGKSNIEKVYSISNSFRKEKSSFTKLTEFQHVEFEGKLTQDENKNVAEKLIHFIIDKLCSNCGDSLDFFLTKDQHSSLRKLDTSFTNIDFQEVCKILQKETSNNKYLDFSLKHFKDWEEILVSNLIKEPIWIEGFPLYEIPFYHKSNTQNFENSNSEKSLSSDLILPGFRETIGSGERISEINEIMLKQRLFQLPEEPYNRYSEIRTDNNYKITSGFGLGLNRLCQWILKLPLIEYTTVFPRTEKLTQSNYDEI